MFWFYYALCTIIGGILVGRLSLEMLKHPGRYPKCFERFFFPFSSLERRNGWPLLCGAIGMQKWHLRNDAGEDGRKIRASYIFLTMLFLPIRLCYCVTMTCLISLMIMIFKFVEIVIFGGAWIISRCRSCVDV